MSSTLTSLQSKRRKPKRQLSNGVVSRWYRPPEIIMALPQYSFAADMWSLGCVLAELLFASEDYQGQKRSGDDRFLFQGNSCFPLSPFDAGDKSLISKDDQLLKILKLLGKQTGEDLSFIANMDILEYEQKLETRVKHSKSKLKDLFPKSNPQLLQLLENLL